jgi:hypothetical protein
MHWPYGLLMQRSRPLTRTGFAGGSFTAFRMTVVKACQMSTTLTHNPTRVDARW